VVLQLFEGSFHYPKPLGSRKSRAQMLLLMYEMSKKKLKKKFKKNVLVLFEVGADALAEQLHAQVRRDHHDARRALAVADFVKDLIHLRGGCRV